MSYKSISVKEAINHIKTDQWVLPMVQRPYVWGSRYESEEYICKLFDSIMRNYPIGGIILWKTKQPIPFRYFLRELNESFIATPADESKFGSAERSLVYDGQQRLQTLYSCLNYSFNKRILVYNLLFDPSSKDEACTMGFYFKDKPEDLTYNELPLNSIIDKSPDDKSDFKYEFRKKNEQQPDYNGRLIEKNIDDLWSSFVALDDDGCARKPISFFEIESSTPDKVNEIFQRLNSGGIPLSKADLLFSEIKGMKEGIYYNFEDEMISFCQKISKKTNGYEIAPYEILTLLHLYTNGSVRIADELKEQKLQNIVDEWKDSSVQNAIESFFADFLYGCFKINHNRIVPKHSALYPLIIYFIKSYKKGLSFKFLDLLTAKQYFIKSQLNDWNLQSFTDNFTDIVLNNTTDKFPLEDIETFVKNSKNKRLIDVFEQTMCDYVWFSLKILSPDKEYLRQLRNDGRFNPEIDHIFPFNLPKDNEIYDENYKRDVDILWNFQLISGKLNLDKRNYPPYLFFTNQITEQNKILNGAENFAFYEFVEPLENKEVWLDYHQFLSHRKERMLDFMKQHYQITVLETPKTQSSD